MGKTEFNLTAVWNRIGNRFPVIGLWLLAITIVSFFSIFPTNYSSAAEIRKVQNKNCVLEISGVIKSGDLGKFTRMADVHFKGLMIEDTSRFLVCLNSPGGNLVEGIKLAKFFFETGVGTVIDDGQSCLSICGIMFMMGIANGDEGGHINRKMHINSKLGFHSPSIGKKLKGTFSEEQVYESYRLALDSAIQILIMANKVGPWSNKPMIYSDLIEKMFSHIGNDFYYIDSVDKVGRWDIEIFGLEYPQTINENHAYHVCENSSRWPLGLTKELYPLTEHKKYGRDVISIIERTSSSIVYFVVGSGSGDYGHACIVKIAGSDVSACGENGRTSTSVGGGYCDRKNYQNLLRGVRNYSIFHPKTKLLDLTARYSKTSQKSKSPLASSPRCYVIKSRTIIDEEPCVKLTENKTKPITYYVWPSGGKTIIQGRGKYVRINGVDTVGRKVSGYDICYFNRKTGNDFCYKGN